MTGLFIVVDGAFFSANLLKVADGGWLPLLIGAVVYFVMTTWRSGIDCVRRRLEGPGEISRELLARLAAGKVPRVPGTAIFLTRLGSKIPPLLIDHVKHMGALQRRVVTLSVHFEEVPRIEDAKRCSVEHLADGIWHARVRFGFVEIPDLCRALERLPELDAEIDPQAAVYFAARDLIVRKPGRGLLAHWRLPLFSFLYRNAVKVVDRFHLPPREVVEIARQIEI